MFTVAPSFTVKTTVQDGPAKHATVLPSPPISVIGGKVAVAGPCDSAKVFNLTLRAEPGRWRAPLIVRLRHALKALLRGYGLRCVKIEEEKDAD